MNTLFVLICLVALAAGAYFFVRLIMAAIRSQPKSAYLKKLLASAVIVIVSSVVVYQTRTPEQIAAQQSKIESEQKAAKETTAPKELTPEEKAAKEARKQKEEEERRQRQAEFEASEKQRKQDEMLKALTTGWNLKTTDTDADHVNWEKATDLVKKYPDYIHSAEVNWISAEDALKKPWEYYGKVVNLSGRIYSINQLPPGNSVAQFFGGNCYHAMLAIGGGYDPVTLSMYIVGDSANITEDSVVNVKGYIFGHAKLVNRMGGSSRGLAFVGFQE